MKITIWEMKHLPTKDTLSPDGFTYKNYPIFKERMPITYKLLQKIEHPNSSYETTFTLLSKSEKLKSKKPPINILYQYKC